MVIAKPSVTVTLDSFHKRQAEIAVDNAINYVDNGVRLCPEFFDLTVRIYLQAYDAGLRAAVSGLFHNSSIVIEDATE